MKKMRIVIPRGHAPLGWEGTGEIAGEELVVSILDCQAELLSASPLECWGSLCERKATCAAPEKGCGAIPESHDFEAKAVCFECSPEMNSKSRDGWPCKWLFAGGLSESFSPGNRTQGCPCAQFSVWSHHLTWTIPWNSCSLGHSLGSIYCAFGGNGWGQVVVFVWKDSSQIGVAVWRVSACRSRWLSYQPYSARLHVETVRKKGIPDCEEEQPSLC